jgi:hypothetical protein
MQGFPGDFRVVSQKLSIDRKNRFGADQVIGYLLGHITNGGRIMGFQIQPLAAENF